ncbi:PhoH family protein [Desulfosarcina ovata]|uniref:Phosphate starvation protein PhoH n=1 Tax=Desulfosarcina ovata subsp. ovata TaxID=2752305 RepID=A0A5K8AHG1_9BACT|nr:PhoH family protein [Desulfosarcina ovata]BBO92133.1 phosphate starvation protein PhoH [Desulfosarcina ovata subsp. ovata]
MISFSTEKRKIFVLDTNIILHDSSCINQFDEHDVVVPIAVIEELDRFKKGKEILNCNAREFARALDRLTGDRIFNGGVPIGPGKGKITVYLDRDFHDTLKANFAPDKPDHHILNAAYHIACENSFERVILVTKDVNLRMKAKSIGLMAQDYNTDRVQAPADIYKGTRVVADIPSSVIDQLWAKPFEMDAAALELANPLLANEYLIMKNGSKSALGVYLPQTGAIRRIDTQICYGIRPRNAEQCFAVDALTNHELPLVTITGKAGTGKTLLALAAALEKRRHYRQIFISRPSVPLSNKDIGFLPGDIQSKLDPYMQPLYDNLAVIESNQNGKSGNLNGNGRRVKDLLEEEKIIITPLSYIRGRSIVKVFFIVDEAQNLTPHEVKTIITRAGEGTKIVFTGDIYQIDHPYLDGQSNGLSYLIEKMKGQRLYTHINLEKGERSELSELAISLL